MHIEAGDYCKPLPPSRLLLKTAFAHGFPFVETITPLSPERQTVVPPPS